MTDLRTLAWQMQYDVSQVTLTLTLTLTIYLTLYLTLNPDPNRTKVPDAA